MERTVPFGLFTQILSPGVIGRWAVLRPAV
jgi:hypothetical protein